MSIEYPYSRILYKIDDTPGWHKGRIGGTEDECEEICKKLKEEGKILQYKRWGGGTCLLDIPHHLQKYDEEAYKLHMVTDLIYNTGDKKYYFPDEKMPYPDKCSPRSTSKFHIDAKVSPEKDDDSFIMDDFEDEFDFKDNTTAMLYFEPKVKICIETEPVLADIPQFLKQLKKEGYANLIISEYWYSKFLAWKKGNKIRFIIQSYGHDVVEVILNKFVREEVFFSEFKKLTSILKKGLKRKQKLYEIFKNEEALLKRLPWTLDKNNMNHIEEYIDLNGAYKNLKHFKNFIKKIEGSHKKQEEFDYRIENNKLIRHFYLDYKNQEIKRYIRLYGLPEKNTQLTDLYCEVIHNHGRKAIYCQLGDKEAIIYEDGGIEAPLENEQKIQNLKNVIKEIIEETNKNDFSVDEFFSLLREHGIDTSSYRMDRFIHIEK